VAITAYKKYEDARPAISKDGRSRSVSWIAHGTSDPDIALQTLLDTVPPAEGGLQLMQIGEVRRLGAQSFEADATYGPFVGGLPDPSLIEFPGRDGTLQLDTSGSTYRMIVSKESSPGVLKDTDADGTAPPDCKGLIHATQDGIEGVEVPKRGMQFTITRPYTTSQLNGGLFDAITNATKCMNSSAVTLTVDGISKTFAKGELFLENVGLSRADSDGVWRFSFTFKYAPNFPNQTIVQGLKPFAMQGHDYLEVQSEAVPTGAGKVPTRKAITAFVHRVFDYFDFNTLGI